MTKEEFMAKAEQLKHADSGVEFAFSTTKKNYNINCSVYTIRTEALRLRYLEAWDDLFGDDVRDIILKAKHASVSDGTVIIQRAPHEFKGVDIYLSDGSVIRAYRNTRETPDFPIMTNNNIKYCWRAIKEYSRDLDCIRDLIPAFYDVVLDCVEKEMVEKLDALDVSESVGI